jgi:hypothetical protein
MVAAAGELPPDPFGPEPPADHARAQAMTAAKVARMLRDDPPADPGPALDQLVRATREVAGYFGLTLEEL